MAQAFGLATAATDIVSGTYLYQLPPAATLGFVQKLQLAFRNQAEQNRALIHSPTTAYYYVQRYLNLCLPPSIEAAITNQLSTAEAVAVSNRGGPLFSIETFSAPSADASVQKTSNIQQQGGGVARRVIKADAPLPPTPPPPAAPAGAATLQEKTMSPALLEKYQVTLFCVPPSPKFDSATREGIRVFQEYESLDETGQIGGKEAQLLATEFMNQNKGCQLGARNFFETQQYFPRNQLDKAQVVALQKALNAAGASTPESGNL